MTSFKKLYGRHTQFFMQWYNVHFLFEIETDRIRQSLKGFVQLFLMTWWQTESANVTVQMWNVACACVGRVKSYKFARRCLPPAVPKLALVYARPRVPNRDILDYTGLATPAQEKIRCALHLILIWIHYLWRVAKNSNYEAFCRSAPIGVDDPSDMFLEE